jgi:hypothetical protein
MRAEDWLAMSALYKPGEAWSAKISRKNRRNRSHGWPGPTERMLCSKMHMFFVIIDANA